MPKSAIDLNRTHWPDTLGHTRRDAGFPWCQHCQAESAGAGGPSIRRLLLHEGGEAAGGLAVPGDYCFGVDADDEKYCWNCGDPGNDVLTGMVF